ncbi:PAS domain-containing protein [Allopontixanthobacter sediminis]|uniref:PAS domain-containing protein n=1 Tax=Allopontixanthobacter sediminis TaxID=1689985 RepID=A0A845AYF4_9SPHN|nr:hypothetical protein [Allopontixanthobacter sediminis]MXP44533.1 hypothetical protein [Allopontixanthobacter sediminis]
MDTLRGNFGTDDFDQAKFGDALDDGLRDWGVTEDASEEDSVSEPPPAAIGTDERRMQVRAYNHWASLLGDYNFPLIEDLEPESLPDFGPYSVVLDFTLGMENPGIQYLGDQLAVECGTHEEIDALSDIPSRSLLSRITDHYMQILANQAPIGFEAEFVNQRGATILYRGILLPFSSDGEAIDFIYGVINWKEMADQMTTDELMLEIDQALGNPEDDTGEQGGPLVAETLRAADPVTEWADGPAAEPQPVYQLGLDNEFEDEFEDEFGEDEDDEAEDEDAGDSLPSPLFGAKKSAGLSAPRKVPLDLSAGDFFVADDQTDYFGAEYTAPEYTAPEYAGPEHSTPAQDEGLFDCLASARELASVARSSEDRSRSALYAAVGRAYDFSLAAQEEEQEFGELVSANGLTFQERAPMTPVVKLVFGADYDKTRLTEYAAVLSHAHRMDIGRGQLAGFLAQAEGGLKGVVRAERQLRREDSGKDGEQAESPQEKLARKLRNMPTHSFDALSSDGDEFALVMIRRMPDGEIVLLGEISGDAPMVERAARKLVG